MTARKTAGIVLGGLLAINFSCVFISPVSAQEIEYRAENAFSPGDEFTREIKKEHDLHEQNVQALRDEYPDPDDIYLLDAEMKKERNRHAQRMREIHRQYYNAGNAQE